MNLLRRKFLKTATFVGAAVTVGTGALVPQRAIGAYMKAAFEATDVNGAMSAAMGSVSARSFASKCSEVDNPSTTSKSSER